MASIRDLKKSISQGIYDIVEEAYSVKLFQPGKHDKKADKVIDSAADFLEEARTRINDARRSDEGKDSLRKLIADWEKKSESLRKELNTMR